MRALVVYCHPREESFNAAIRDLVLDRLKAADAEIRLRDLYAEGFDPVLSAREHESYERHPDNLAGLEKDSEDLLWCDTLIFVYPTWWYGHPAMLKGWLDRAFLPEVAFLMPKADGETIRPNLTHIKRLGVYTTCGASRWLTFFVGAPGKRIITRGLRLLIHKRAKVSFAAHYLMDSSTSESRAAHLDLVERKLNRLIKARSPAR